MLRLIWALSVHTPFSLRRYMPTNILLDAIRTCQRRKWGVFAMFLAVPYAVVASLCGTAVENGGPSWLNLVLLLAAWNMLKFLIMGPVSVIFLVQARLREAACRRRERRSGRAEKRDGTREALGFTVTSS